MRAKVDLLDANLWIALSVPDHAHHTRAKRYWYEEAAERVSFCNVTALALLRLLTQPAVMGGEPLTVAQSWVMYRALRDLPEVIILGEPEGCETYFETWAKTGEANPRLWTDAYLASFAMAGHLRLVTFDRDFKIFPSLQLLHLTI